MDFIILYVFMYMCFLQFLFHILHIALSYISVHFLLKLINIYPSLHPTVTIITTLPPSASPTDKLPPSSTVSTDMLDVHLSHSEVADMAVSAMVAIFL